MKDLIDIFLAAGCKDVSSYIQSGNVIFNAPKSVLKRLPEKVEEQILARFGFTVPVILRSSEELARTAQENPFLRDGKPEKTLHVMFLADVPDSKSVANLDPHRSPPDQFHVFERDVYLHFPERFGQSKLTNAYFDSKLSTKSTVRNWNTVIKLLELSSRL